MSVTIDGYDIDAFLSVDPSFQSQVTPHPIEEGADASDHIIIKPTVLMVTGVVSDTPIGEIANVRDEGVVPSSDAYARLLEIRTSKRLVTVVTGVYPPFTNMALRSLSPPKTARTGDSLVFRATFEQITTVDVAIENKVTLVNLPRQKKKKRKGHNASESTPDAKKPPVASEGKSILFNLLD